MFVMLKGLYELSVQKGLMFVMVKGLYELSVQKGLMFIMVVILVYYICNSYTCNTCVEYM